MTPSRKNSIPISWLSMLSDQGIVNPSILAHPYEGEGTPDKPHVVTFFEGDPRDPMQFSSCLRWFLCIAVGFVTFSVAFISSAYVSAIPEIALDFGGNPTVHTLGLSLFVVGFIVGPFFWAPLSEMYGRQYVLVLSTTAHVSLNIAICLCWDLKSLLSLRLLSGAFGAAPLTNSGGVIADTFPPRTRGLAITCFALVPLFAPVLGPIASGFVAEKMGWRYLMGVMAALSASSLVVALIGIPETYAPVLLRKRAESLRMLTSRAFVPAVDIPIQKDSSRSKASYMTMLSRPFVLAFHEPIVSLLALYQAIVFGTVYLTFAAFPIVFNESRGWSQGLGGLAFLGIFVGTLFAVPFQIWDNKRYVKLLCRRVPHPVPPEARLPSCCIGSVSILLGLLWFACTNDPRIHCLVSIAAGIPFGFGVVLITIGSTNYLVDAYTMFAASAITVCICGRAIFGAVFPLFTRALYNKLGIFWGSLVPAILALICTPLPFVFYYNGHKIRARCRYAAQSEEYMRRVRGSLDIEEHTPLLIQSGGAQSEEQI
ncbi:synaptic vesicle transporter, partial [Aureobasidium melanogenum]